MDISNYNNIFGLTMIIPYEEWQRTMGHVMLAIIVGYFKHYEKQQFGVEYEQAAGASSKVVRKGF